MQKAIRKAVALAELVEELVRADDRFELCAPRPFSTVCFRLKASDEASSEASDEVNEALLEQLNSGGVAFLSHTRLHDQFVIRWAIGNARTSEEDIRLTWQALERSVEAVASSKS